MLPLNVIKKLTERYDYGGALDVLTHHEKMESDAFRLIDSCRSSVNFDFVMALERLKDLSQEKRELTSIIELKANLEALIQGEPDALLSELLENVKFQIVNEEYIDFLGRVYRFKEALYKYMFMKAQLKDRPFTFQNRFMQKKEILKILRNHYKIFNSNLIFALNTYFRKYTHDPVIHEVLSVLGSQKMNQLIELRHDSIIGHGFKGISLEDIQSVYGNPYEVLDDFRLCIESLGSKVYRYKYAILNDMIMEWLYE